MSSIVEIDPSDSVKEVSANGITKDDVFPSLENDQVADLSCKFEQMLATENAYQPLTDIFCNMRNQNQSVLNKYASENNLKNDNPGSTMKQCTFQTTMTRYSSCETDSKTNLTASYVMYACQTASDTLIEGIRASVRQVLTNVPRIVINGAAERDLVTCENSSNSSVGGLQMKGHESKIWFGNTGSSYNSGTGKLIGRHRSRTYYRPYCLLSRRHYNCQPLAIRRRKYGVSQKGNIEPGVNELTKLLDNLATTDDKKEHPSTTQISPPPEYYMIRYRPSATLAKIRERSRSLNDLSLQSLQITTPAHSVDKNDVDNLSSADYSSADKTLQTATTMDANNGTSGSQICQMVTGIGKLNMVE